MPQTSYLRPLMTKDYLFDFPSHYTLKQICLYTKLDYHELHVVVNDLMKKIMDGSKLFYVISNKSSEEVIGYIEFTFETNDQKIAEFSSDLVPDLSVQDVNEIAKRAAEVVSMNLDLEKITFSSKNNDIVKESVQNAFNNK